MGVAVFDIEAADVGAQLADLVEDQVMGLLSVRSRAAPLAPQGLNDPARSVPEKCLDPGLGAEVVAR
jgi:hypothetical protein